MKNIFKVILFIYLYLSFNDLVAWPLQGRAPSPLTIMKTIAEEDEKGIDTKLAAVRDLKAEKTADTKTALVVALPAKVEPRVEQALHQHSYRTLLTALGQAVDKQAIESMLVHLAKIPGIDKEEFLRLIKSAFTNKKYLSAYFLLMNNPDFVPEKFEDSEIIHAIDAAGNMWPKVFQAGLDRAIKDGLVMATFWITAMSLRDGIYNQFDFAPHIKTLQKKWPLASYHQYRSYFNQSFVDVLNSPKLKSIYSLNYICSKQELRDLLTDENVALGWQKPPLQSAVAIDMNITYINDLKLEQIKRTQNKLWNKRARS